MKRWYLSFALIALLFSTSRANGVCIVNATDGAIFRLVSSDVTVSVNNQIATVTTVQVFQNLTGADTLIKYAFPMSETGSAVSLRWLNYGAWFEASFAPVPQDTTLPGGGGGGGGGGTVDSGFVAEFEPAVPSELKVQASPNPFSSLTRLRFEIPSNLFRVVDIEIVNAEGRVVKTLMLYVGESGKYEITWHGTDESGQPVPKGIYWVRVNLGETHLTGKIIKQ